MSDHLRIWAYGAAGVATWLLSAGAGAADELGLRAALAGLEHPAAVFVTGPGAPAPYGAAAGHADPDLRRPLTIDTPMRMASVTKTFTAATALRLHEQGRLDLDRSVADLLDPELEAILRADGFDTRAITVRHLLRHRAGLYDHGGDKRFLETVLAEPNRRWSRKDQVALSAAYADPQGPPGAAFIYSDTGYVLLGDILERVTGQTLAAAVRKELRLDGLGLSATWWERFERPPASAEARARQWLPAAEATDIDPSMDLYGGGGLLMSARDLGRFVEALFGGRIFDRPETLELMLSPAEQDGPTDYKHGIFKTRAEGRDLYWHSGFWGTIYVYDPQSRRVAAGVTTHQAGFRALRRLVEQEAAGQ